MNVVVISGNLTRDPEIKSTTGGASVLNFSVAVNDRRKNNQTGEWENVPNYIDCVMFGQRADSLGKILTKGMKVTVNGKLSYSSWERDGQRRSRIEVFANDVELPPRPKGQQAQSQRQDDFFDDGIPF